MLAAVTFLEYGFCEENFESLKRAPVTQDFNKAIHLAKVHEKPLALVFLGSDWCKWSRKFEKEILNDPVFHEKLNNRFIFVKLDFPEVNPQPESVFSQNYSLKQQFKVESFPTLVLLDSEGYEITRTGYRKGRGKVFADHLNHLFDEYLDLQNALAKGLGNQSSKVIETIYERAKNLGTNHLTEKILNEVPIGKSSPKLLIARYNKLLAKGVKQDLKVLRDHIEKKDPNNEAGALAQLAVIDFQNEYTQSPARAIKDFNEAVETLKKKKVKGLSKLETLLTNYSFEVKQEEK